MKTTTWNVQGILITLWWRAHNTVAYLVHVPEASGFDTVPNLPGPIAQSFIIQKFDWSGWLCQFAIACKNQTHIRNSTCLKTSQRQHRTRSWTSRFIAFSNRSSMAGCDLYQAAYWRGVISNCKKYTTIFFVYWNICMWIVLKKLESAKARLTMQ